MLVTPVLSVQVAALPDPSHPGVVVDRAIRDLSGYPPLARRSDPLGSRILFEREPEPTKPASGCSGNGRPCTAASSANHNPVLQPVAQRGAQDDCTKSTIGNKKCKSKRRLLQLKARNNIHVERAASDLDHLHERGRSFDYGHILDTRDDLEVYEKRGEVIDFALETLDF